MLARIPEVLTVAQLAECRKALAQADWVDGRVTAGHRSQRVKDNMQVPELHPAARRLGAMILTELERNPSVSVRGAAAQDPAAALQPL